MRNIIITIFIVVTSSVILIYILQSNQQNDSYNDFVRKIIPVKVVLKMAVRLPNKSFSFAGRLDESIKLTSFANRLNLYQSDYSLKLLDTIPIQFPASFYTHTLNIYKNVLAPYVYCSNPSGDISVSDNQRAIYYKITDLRFDFIQALAPTTLIVRARRTKKQEINRSIAKLTLANGKANVIAEYSLPNKINGFFANDGIIHYDKANSRILYMYFYRGEFLSLDTNLNLMYSSKTIDTVKTAVIKTEIISKKEKNTFKISQTIRQTSLPRFTSTYITTNNNQVYILSKLKGDNEPKSTFISNQVVDIYNIDDGKYLKSFYIPKFKGEKLTQFQIRENELVAIYDTWLITYSFHE